MLKENEIKLLDAYLTKDPAKTHFLFFYYLMNNKLDEAAKLFMNLDPKITKKLSLLQIYLKSYIKHLPQIASNELYLKYPFLKDQELIFDENEMIIEQGNQRECIEEQTYGFDNMKMESIKKKKKVMAFCFGFSEDKNENFIKKEIISFENERNEGKNRLNFEFEAEKSRNFNTTAKKKKYSFNFSSKVNKN